MATRNLPKIPRSEYSIRWERVQRILEEKQLDLILAYADDRFTYGAAYARYFADLPTTFEDVLVLFIKDRAPILLVGPETEGWAQEKSVIKDIRVLQEFSAENEDYPYTKMIALHDLLTEVSSTDIKKVGIGAKGYMGAKLYEKIRAAIPEADFICVDQNLDLLREVKSEAEISVIKYAYYLVNIGMEAAMRVVAPGVSEKEIAAEAEYVMRKAGSEGCGIDTIVSSGTMTKHIITKPTDRIVEKNDLVTITLAPRYEGYHGACGRTIIVGNPGQEKIDAISSTIEAQKLCSANLVAGRSGHEVERMGRDTLARCGYEKNFLYSGLHSVGVIEFETPILGPSSTTVIRDNMVISIDIPLFEADGFGCRTEDGYLIHDGKGEKLTTAELLVCK